MQHASDQEILRAIGHGQREFGWGEWFGDVEGADYLTDCGSTGAHRPRNLGTRGPFWILDRHKSGSWARAPLSQHGDTPQAATDQSQSADPGHQAPAQAH
jgi:hypothetical protein